MLFYNQEDIPGNTNSSPETLHPGLLLVIQEIASAKAAAHGRRWSEQLSSVKALDELRESLVQFGCTLSIIFEGSVSYS